MRFKERGPIEGTASTKCPKAAMKPSGFKERGPIEGTARTIVPVLAFAESAVQGERPD